MKQLLMVATLLICSLPRGFARAPEWFKRRLNELDQALSTTDRQERIGAIGDFIGIRVLLSS
jgi:hypothetical protein